MGNIQSLQERSVSRFDQYASTRKGNNNFEIFSIANCEEIRWRLIDLLEKYDGVNKSHDPSPTSFYFNSLPVILLRKYFSALKRLLKRNKMSHRIVLRWNSE